MNTPNKIKLTGKTPKEKQVEFQSKVSAVKNAVRVEFKNNKGYVFFPHISRPQIFSMA